ncbi:MAG TPA: DoxX family membrane protein [bacterium]|nr:DoxX family membrane protein [bacterium]
MTWLQRIVLGTRVLLGLVFFITGIIGLLGLAPLPTNTQAAANFIAALRQTGYLFTTVMGVQLFCGAMLILGFFVPLMLLLLAPIVVNILLYQALLDPTPVGMMLGIVPLVLEVLLAFFYRQAFLALLQARAPIS